MGGEEIGQVPPEARYFKGPGDTVRKVTDAGELAKILAKPYPGIKEISAEAARPSGEGKERVLKEVLEPIQKVSDALIQPKK